LTDHLAEQLASMAPHRALPRAVEGKVMGAITLVEPVLDVGCGEGHFASITYREPIAVGIDVHQHELVEAQRRGPSVYRAVARADATALPFAAGAFRTVVSNSVVEHIADQEALLAEVARVLQVGGTLALTVPSEHFSEMLLGATLLRRLRLPGLSARYGRFFNRISHHHHVHDITEWRRRLGAVGLEVIDHHYYFSARAHRLFDAAHYLSVPNLISRGLTGRWVLHRFQARPFERLMRRSYEEPVRQPVGAYQFLRCTRTAEVGRG
jgi:SAM-dependent methyltransferase